MVVDKGGIGGHASSSALTRNFLGFPRGISGSRLAQQAHEQAWILGARFALMQTVTELVPDDERLVLRLSEGGEVSARVVVLATGASYRRLGVPRLIGPLRHASACRRSEKNSSAFFVLVSYSPVRSMPCWVRNALVSAPISNASEGAQLGGMPAGEAAYQQGHVTRPASEGHGAASRRIASAAAIRGASICAIAERTMLQPA